MDSAIQTFIKELQQKKVLPQENVTFTSMSGTTASIVGILSCDNNALFVIKTEDRKQIEVTSAFLTAYKHVSILPDLYYVDPMQRYVIYTYIPDNHNYHPGAKTKLLHTLSTHLFHFYQPCRSLYGWGWADEPSSSWSDFLIKRITEAKPFVSGCVPDTDFEMVQKAAQDSSRLCGNADPYLLHGDCGIHNFLFDSQGDLQGIIDPIPVLGPPIYDLTFAFCSSPDELVLDAIIPAAIHLYPARANDPAWLREEVLIALYCRLAACRKHHPQDLSHYLTAWSYWKSLV
ncbi:phosphotransferase [Aneurinibacillus sp. REN35]|uniref:phosphotransferase n=1 Tax=Aneurinibacillus sp. REN35 TaxID=3237286 RepID=UPI0035275C62